MHELATQVVEDEPDAADGAEDGRRPTGRIVGVIRRNWRTRGYCGSLKPGQRGGAHSAAVLFVPVERRFPMIRVHTRQVNARPPRQQPSAGRLLNSAVGSPTALRSIVAATQACESFDIF